MTGVQTCALPICTSVLGGQGGGPQECPHPRVWAADIAKFCPVLLASLGAQSDGKGGSMKKGDVLAVAQVAGIMGAKNCSSMIPMCHPISLTGVDINFEYIQGPHDFGVAIEATTRCCGETGVEMEAICAVSCAAATIYDMCKAVQRDMVITDICLQEKTGGKSGHFVRGE